MIDSLIQWLEAHPQWLGAAIFLATLIECLAIAGLLIPGTILLFALALLSGNSGLRLWETLLIAWIGGFCGDLLSYWLGRHQHQRIRALPYIRDHLQWLEKAEEYFQRYGVISLLVGRFIGPLRPLLPMIAGMCEMPFIRFFLISLLASAGWAVAYLLPGWSTGAALRVSVSEDFWLQAGIVVGSLLVLIGLAIYGCMRAQPRLTSWISAGCLLLAALLLALWPHLQTLDQGIYSMLHKSHNSSVDTLMLVLTQLGDPRPQWLVGAWLVALLLCLRQVSTALFAGTTLLSTFAAVSLIKPLIARARPEPLAQSLGSFSMPSGHSASAFALFLVLGVLAGRGQPRRWRITWLCLAALSAGLIALSRVYLGAHWCTDILAGALLAAGLCAASMALLEHNNPVTAAPKRFWVLFAPSALLIAGLYAFQGLPSAALFYQVQ